MFKFIQQYAEKMQDANIYPTISLIIFVLFFVTLLFLVKKMGQERVSELSNLPLDNDEPANSNV